MPKRQRPHMRSYSSNPECLLCLVVEKSILRNPDMQPDMVFTELRNVMQKVVCIYTVVLDVMVTGGGGTEGS